MSLRRLAKGQSRCAALAVLAFTWAACARGKHEQLPPVKEKTQVLGNIPGTIEGTWLLVANSNVVSDKYRNTAAFYRIERRDGRLEVHQLHISLPPSMARDLDEANRAYRPWTISEDQAELVRRSLPSLPPAEPKRLSGVDFKLATPEHYAELLSKQPDILAGSKLALLVDERFKPRRIKPHERVAQLMKNTVVYAIERIGKSKLEGEHLRMTLAAGFVPIPIKMHGPFVMYRVGPAKSRGGIFSGCR